MGKYGIGRVATTIAPSGGDDGMVEITYRSTKVVRYNDRAIVLTSGGYRTVTTKRRMMEVSTAFNLGYRVWQIKFNWFVFWRGQYYPFSDHMRLDRMSGAVTDQYGAAIEPSDL